jgi:hypothetical protein
MSAPRIDRATRTTGRRRGTPQPFAMIPTDVLLSPAWRTLPHAARTVLTVLAAQYSGRYNGSVTLTQRTAREYGITTPRTLYAALRELVARGLVVQTRPGTRLPPRSAMYALGWRPIDDPLGHDPHHARPTLAPPDEWRGWTASVNHPHWAAARRAPRWRRGTRMTDDAVLTHADMTDHAVLTAANSPGPRGTHSHISGRGSA